MLGLVFGFDVCVDAFESANSICMDCFWFDELLLVLLVYRFLLVVSDYLFCVWVLECGLLFCHLLRLSLFMYLAWMICSLVTGFCVWIAVWFCGLKFACLF